MTDLYLTPWPLGLDWGGTSRCGMISLSIPCYRVICVKADLTVNSLCVWREMDVDLEQVPSQSGTAILDINDGKILKLTGDMDTETGRQQCEKLFRVMLDCGKTVGDEQVQRISISFTSYRFVLTTAKQLVYIVKLPGSFDGNTL